MKIKVRKSKGMRCNTSESRGIFEVGLNEESNIREEIRVQVGCIVVLINMVRLLIIGAESEGKEESASAHEGFSE